jgi:hypothetical protein
MNIQEKANKLIYALSLKGYIYLVSKEQFFSSKFGKVCTKHKLFELIPVEEYNLRFPDNKKDPKKCTAVKHEMIETFKPIDILLLLADEYKKVGDING